MKSAPIVVEQSFDAPIETVWKAISDQDEMRKWFFETMSEFRPEVGFETRFNVHAEGKDYLHVWKVTEVVERQKLAYQWRYEGYPGDSVVTWELKEQPGGTKLTFSHTGQESIEGDPLFTRENCQAGWDYLIRQNLKQFLDQPQG